MRMTEKYAGQLLLLLSMLVVPGTTASAATRIKVMTYNTHHGGTATWPTSLKFELKSGTSRAEIAPGSAYFDNFHAVTDCRIE
jgi:hypothetical protein